MIGFVFKDVPNCPQTVSLDTVAIIEKSQCNPVLCTVTCYVMKHCFTDVVWRITLDRIAVVMLAAVDKLTIYMHGLVSQHYLQLYTIRS